MRTNVILDETLVARAKALTGIKTTREVLDEALRVLIRLREQGQVRELRGRLQWEGDLAALREARIHAYEVAAKEADPRVAG
ncbi:MAG: type II toxin-antitoxin system VapB family antitoxin [Anaerolineae bacterium]